MSENKGSNKGGRSAQGRKVSVTTRVSLSDWQQGLTTAKAAWARRQDADHAALLTCSAFVFGSFRDGMIGADAPEGGFKSQREAAAAFGVGQTTLVMWRRYGRAVSLGVPEDTLNRIVQWFGDGRISEALDSGSKTAIVKAVKSITAPDGKRVPVAKPNANKGETKGTAKDEDALPPTRNNSTVTDAIETLIARYTALTPAEAKRVDGLVERLNSVPRKAARKAATAA